MTQENHMMRVRMPNELKDRLEEAGQSENRSINSEILSRLEQSFRAVGQNENILELQPHVAAKVRKFQQQNNIDDFAEAANRLLGEALQARNSLEDILEQVMAALKAKKELRWIMKYILTDHIQVRRVEVNAAELKFSLENGRASIVKSDGDIRIGVCNDDGAIWADEKWPYTPPPPPYGSKPAGSVWDTRSAGADLDDDIPF